MYAAAGERGTFMTHPASLLGVVALGVVLASSCAQAQTVHHRAHHPAAAAAGQQIIVREDVEPWLTLGTWAPVGSRKGYVLDTLADLAWLRPTKRHSGVRGIDRLPNDVSLPRIQSAIAHGLGAWPERPLAGFCINDHPFAR